MAAPSATKAGSYAWRGDAIGMHEWLTYDANHTTDDLPQWIVSCELDYSGIYKAPIQMTDKQDGPGDACLVSWPWPAVLLVSVEAGPTDALPSRGNRLLFVAPTAEGLETLEKSEQSIGRMWLLAAGVIEPGTLHVEQVDEISTWNLRTPGGRQLSVLRGQKGRLIAIEDDDAFVLQPSSTDWTGSGPYKRAWLSDAGDHGATGD